MGSATKIQTKNLHSSPDEVLTSEKEKIEMVSLEDLTLARMTLQPGWSWEKQVKPKAKTNSCEVHHTSYIISGRMKTVMDDGTEVESGAGTVAVVPPGHNTWVVR